MGQGIINKCKNCGCEFDVLEGVGFMAPQIEKEFLDKINNGEFGEQYKKLVEENPNIIVDVNMYTYECQKCHYWENEPGLDLYVPVNYKNVHGVYNTDYKKDCKLLKRYIRKCPHCNRRLKKVEWIGHLKCPECGFYEERQSEGLEILDITDLHEYINWD